MDVVSLLVKIVLCIVSLFLIIVVLLQDENPQGAPVAAGGKKARGMQALLAKMTKASAVVFMVLAVVLVLLEHFF